MLKNSLFIGYFQPAFSIKRRISFGASLVEMAIAISLFFLVVFGIIEFGFLMYNQQIITNAAREGARFGIVSRPEGAKIDQDDVKQLVTDYAEKNIVAFGNKNFNVTAIFNSDPSQLYCDQTQEELVVTATYDYTFLFLPFAQKTLSARSIMLCE